MADSQILASFFAFLRLNPLGAVRRRPVSAVSLLTLWAMQPAASRTALARPGLIFPVLRRGQQAVSRKAAAGCRHSPAWRQILS